MPDMRRFLTGIALVAVAACTDTTGTEDPLPAWAERYIFYYPQLSYTYVDSTPTTDLRYDWAADSTFEGYTCVQLAPTNAGDTVGQFRFKINGLNRGTLQRTRFGTIDFLPAYFLPPVPLGTRGSFVRHANGVLDLTWADGDASRYFDPAAVLAFDAGDTLRSDVTLPFTNGYVEWHVGWIPSAFC